MVNICLLVSEKSLRFEEEKGIGKHTFRWKLENIDKRAGVCRHINIHTRTRTAKAFPTNYILAFDSKQNKQKRTGKIFLHIFDSFSRVINYQTHKSFPTRSPLFISLWFAFDICLSEDDGAQRFSYISKLTLTSCKIEIPTKLFLSQ